MLRGALFLLAISATLVCRSCGPSLRETERNSDEAAQSKQREVEKQLQGQWVVVECWTCDGAEWSTFEEDEGDEELVFEFAGDKCSAIEGGERAQDWERFSIDASQSPMRIDFWGTKGVFRVDGNKLTICGGVFARPTSLAFADRILAEQYVLKKVESP